MEEEPSLTKIRQISGGDEVFEKKLLDVIKKELPIEIKEYRVNLENGKYLKVAKNVHKLKHKINIFGLEKSYNVAVEYEDNLKENNPGLQYRFDQILNVMVKFITQI